MWPVQTVVNILCITWFPDPDDVIMRNEPEQLQNTSAILEVSLAPTIFATSLPMGLLPYFHIISSTTKMPMDLGRFAASRLRGVCVPSIYIVNIVTAEL